MFALTHQHLRHLLDLNDWPAPLGEGLIFFGLRGCTPADPLDQGWATEQRLELAEVDHLHPRCTLLQWRPASGEIAAFPGSTTPHASYMREALAVGGQGANELLTGWYGDFRKGMHKAGTPNAHAAFVQTAPRVYRRTADDLDYDAADPAETGNPHDNLHAAWCESVDSIRYASAGCQVVVGYPASPARNGQEAGPWATFRRNAYAIPQVAFPYVLVTGLEVQRLVAAGPAGMRRLRFGSRGARVERLQEALRVRGFYPGLPLGDFGETTLRAVLQAQARLLGPGAADGVVGPATARALGISQLID